MKAKPKTKKTTKKKTAKPTKAKALTQRQQFGKDLQAFEQRVNEKLDAFRQALNGVVEKTWKNIQLMNNGLATAEAHVVIIRRVIDDSLNDVLVERGVTAQKKELVDGVETLVDVPARMVNWTHYTSWFMAEQAKAQAARQAAEDQSRKEAEAAQSTEASVGTEQPAVEAKKEEPLAPPQDSGIPEGATVFGGEGA